MSTEKRGRAPARANQRLEIARFRVEFGDLVSNLLLDDYPAGEFDSLADGAISAYLRTNDRSAAAEEVVLRLRRDFEIELAPADRMRLVGFLDEKLPIRALTTGTGGSSAALPKGE